VPYIPLRQPLVRGAERLKLTMTPETVDPHEDPGPQQQPERDASSQSSGQGAASALVRLTSLLQQREKQSPSNSLQDGDWRGPR
jgi:hypothetical protein